MTTISSTRPEPVCGMESWIPTPARILKREDGLIDWQRPARAIFNRARGFLPWPGAWTWFRGDRFNVWKCRPVSSSEWIAGEELAPGLLHVVDKRLLAVQQHTTLGRFRFGSTDYDRWAVVYGRVESHKGEDPAKFGASLVIRGNRMIIFLPRP